MAATALGAIPLSAAGRRRSAAALALVGVVATGVAMQGCAASSEPVAAVMEQVALEWRGAPLLAGQHQPACDTVTVGEPVASCGAPRVLSTDLLARYAAVAADLASRRTGAGRSSTVLRGIARLDIAVAATDLGTLTRAAVMLHEAAMRADATTDLLVDYSAIRLQRFAVGHEIRDVVLGLEAASRALRLEPSRADAQWNRALGLTWVSMRSSAPGAWQQYDVLAQRERAGHSPALRDAAPARDARASALTAGWPEATREYAWRVALPTLARVATAGQRDSVAAATRLLDSLVGLLLRDRVDGDVAALRDAVLAEYRTGDTARVAAIHTTLLRLGWTRSAAGRQRPREASQVLDSLLTRGELSVSLRRWILLEQANQRLVVGLTQRALEQYRSLQQAAPASAVLFGVRAAWGEAMALASLGRTAESVAQLGRLEARCRESGLEDCRIGTPAMAAQYTAMLGDVEATESAATRAAQAVGQAPVTPWHWSSALLLRQLAELNDAPLAAEAFDREAIALATALERPDLAMTVMVERTGAAVARRDSAAVASLLEELRTRWMNNQSAEYQEFARSELQLLDAEQLRRSQPARSVAVLDSALRLMEGNANDSFRTPVLVSRARSRIAAGDTSRALLELNDALVHVRARGSGEETVFAAARMARVLEDIAQVSADALRARGDAAGALRALSGLPFRDAATMRCCEPGAGTVLAVRLVRDSLWMWSRASGTWRLSVASLPASTVQAAVALDTAALETLHAVIIGDQVPEALCIDARGSLAQVPWSALRDRARGLFLVEQARIQLVADALAGCRVARVTPSAARVVVVSAGADAGRRALPGARQEAAALWALWGGGTPLVDGSRGSEATLAAMTSATLVHFAGHAIIDRARRDRSYLLLGATRDSMLTGTSIAAARLRRAPLVILGACDAAGGTVGAFGGFDSLAGAFLGAGASQVIAAAWPVADAPTERLMEDLHAALRAGLGATAALQQAQVRALQSRDPTLRSPRVWAAFQVMGSE